MTKTTLSAPDLPTLSHSVIDYIATPSPMAGNFRAVLIFVIFVVDLAVTKFSHPRKLMPKVMVLCKSMMTGVAKNFNCGSMANT